METRIGLLETRIDRVETKLDMIIERLGAMATRAELTNSLWQVAIVCATIAAIVIGAIIGGLGWLETRSTRLQLAPAASPNPLSSICPRFRRRLRGDEGRAGGLAKVGALRPLFFPDARRAFCA